MVALACLYVSVSLGPQAALFAFSLGCNQRGGYSFVPQLCLCVRRNSFMHILAYIAQALSRDSGLKSRRTRNSHLDIIGAPVL